MFRMEQQIIGVCKEIGIFEIAKHQQVQKYTSYDISLTPLWMRASIYLPSKIEICNSTEDQQKYKKPTSFIVKEATYQKQEKISCKYSLVDKCENSIYNDKKYPKTHLGKIQWVLLGKFKYIIYPIHRVLLILICCSSFQRPIIIPTEGAKPEEKILLSFLYNTLQVNPN